MRKKTAVRLKRFCTPSFKNQQLNTLKGFDDSYASELYS